MDWVLAHWSEITTIVFGLLSVAGTIASLTPTTHDDDWVHRAQNLADKLFGRKAE